MSVVPGETECLSFLSEGLGFMIIIVQSVQAESDVGEIPGVGILDIGGGAVSGGVAVGEGHSRVSGIGGVGTSHGKDGIIIVLVLLNIIGDDWESVSDSVLEIGLELIHGVGLDELTQIDGVEDGAWVGKGNNFSGGSVDSGEGFTVMSDSSAFVIEGSDVAEEFSLLTESGQEVEIDGGISPV